ncbi:DUF2272 domain-containing protein [Deinococcus sp.]|uniref:DUF2272 domain-containing protein n=1 Tax=Deinococcus sp. TaxID=47478 RepID=UPI003CC5A5F7
MTLSLPLTSPPAVRRPVLAFGAVHPAVAEVQTRLNLIRAQRSSAGSPGLAAAPLTPDGVFGTRTRAAVLDFQRAEFADPADHDGVVGPRTWARLDAALLSVPAVPVTPPARPVAEVRRQALALLSAYVPSVAGDGRFDEIAHDYGLACLSMPSDECGTTCGFLPHWLLWRLGCGDLEIVNRSGTGDSRYRPAQNLSRLWSQGQFPFVSALSGQLQRGQRPESGDIVLLRRWPDGDSRSEHALIFLEERLEARGRVVWRSADAGQRQGGREAARFRERELTLHAQVGHLDERTVLGWLPLGNLTFDRPPPLPWLPETAGESEPPLAEDQHTADLSDAFFGGLRAVGASLGSDPLHLLQVMMAESGIRPEAHNPHGDASGLIQFMPATLRGLGWTTGHQAFRHLSAEEQLPYVERYYRPYARSGLTSAARLSQATFLPATLAAGSDPQTVLAGQDGPNAGAYRANSALDRRHDGTIRVSDLADALDRRARGPRWTEARERLAAGSSVPSIPVIPPPDRPPSTSARPTLRRGSQGSWVTAAQRLLNRVQAQQVAAGRPGLEGAPLHEDGQFGPVTLRATRSFQERAFVGQPQQQDGVIGPHTWQALDAWADETPATPPPVVPPAPLADWTALRSALVQAAQQEYARWHAGGAARSETDPKVRAALRGYWSQGAGLSGSAADAAIDTRAPWSAAFISWIMRQAGAGTLFRCAAAHTVYCAAAKSNRLRRDLANPFWLYRPSERVPALGDLVCTGREGSGVSYDNVDDGHSRKSHCDVVVEVQPERLVVMGGNVGNTVGRKIIRTDPRGLLLLDGRQSQYYAVLALRNGPAEE